MPAYGSRALRHGGTVAAALLLAASLAACADEDPPAVVGLVQVDPEVLELEVGATATVAATAFDQTGRKLSRRAAAWASDDASIASVDSGEILGRSVGAATITATVDRKSGAVRVTVIPPVVARVEIAPPEAQLHIDETSQLEALPFSSRDTPIDGKAATWTSADPAVASVDEAGMVRGRKPGATTIFASIDGVKGDATIVVVPPISVIRIAPERISILEGESAAFAATVIGTDGSILEDRELAWSSGEPEVAAAADGGAVTGLRPGKAPIYAEAEGIVGMAVVEVGAGPRSLRIEPPALLLQTGLTAGLSAIVTDTAGGERPAADCAWSSTAPGVVRIFDDGAVQTLVEGMARLEARCHGLRASIEATVLPRASLRIVGPGQVPMGGSIRLEVDLAGTPPRGTVRWALAHPDPISSPTPAALEGDGSGASLSGLPFDNPVWPGVVWVSVQAEGRAATRPFVAVPPFTELQAGPYHTCGIASFVRLCWGDSRILLPQGDRAEPVPWSHPMQSEETGRIQVDRISPGETISYGITDRGSLVSWGCDQGCDAHPGSGTRVELELSEGPAFLDVSAGYGIRRRDPDVPLLAAYRAGPSCGLVAGGRIHCWNLDRSPAPFDPAAFMPAAEARSEAATPQAFVALGVGAAFVCALTDDGEAWCWGPGGMDAEDGRSFEAGQGAALPAPLAGAPRFVQLSVGKYHACGLTAAGAAWCWGHSREGALGAGFPGSSETPVPVAGGLVFRQIAASIEHTCGLTTEGRVHCWGKGLDVPEPAPTEGSFESVVTGAAHACALPAGGGVPVCWGDNSRFQLGVFEDGATR